MVWVNANVYIGQIYRVIIQTMVFIQITHICRYLNFVWYTLPQKKRNFSKVAFLLGRRVGEWTLGHISFVHVSMGSFACCSQEHFPCCTWPGVNDPGPGSPWKIWKLKLRFFWGRVYSSRTTLKELVSHLVINFFNFQEFTVPFWCIVLFQTTSLYICAAACSRAQCKSFTFTQHGQDGIVEGECLLEMDQNTSTDATDISQLFGRQWTALPSSTSEHLYVWNK